MYNRGTHTGEVWLVFSKCNVRYIRRSERNVLRNKIS